MMMNKFFLLLIGFFVRDFVHCLPQPSLIKARQSLLSENNQIIIDMKTINYGLQNDLDQNEFNATGERIKLNLSLSKRKVLSPKAPIWLVKCNTNCSTNYTYEPLQNMKSFIDGDFYTDEKNKAVILVRYNQEKKTIQYDGVVGEGSARHVIHSVYKYSTDRSKREDIENDINSNLRQTDESIENWLIDDDEKIIIERNGVNLEKMDKSLDTLYPKLLIVVDYHLYVSLKKDIAETVKYAATFWNIVDQKYAKIDSPKVEIIITGIIIASDEEVLNYVYQSRNNTERADIYQMMENTRLYFSQNFVNETGFRNYDAVFVMTGLEMNLLNGFVDISGLAAKLGGICSNQHNVAIVTDLAANYNTLIATHELGHLLNLPHDFAEECSGISYLFDPVKTSVMSAPSNGTNIFWSECSLRFLEEFSTLKAAACLKDLHHP